MQYDACPTSSGLSTRKYKMAGPGEVSLIPLCDVKCVVTVNYKEMAAY